MKYTLTILLLCFTAVLFAQNVGINNDGSTPDASAQLDVKSTNKGLLIPRLTTEQRNDITSPVEGLTVYDTGKGSFWFFSNGVWHEKHFLLPPNTNFKLLSQLDIGVLPQSVAVQGDFVYVVDGGPVHDLKIINITNPNIPLLTSSLVIGTDPVSLAIQGDFAFVVDTDSDDLKIINISNAANPVLTASLILGGNPQSVDVQGDFAFVVSGASRDLKVINISNQASPVLTGSLSLGTFTNPDFVVVQGEFAFITDKITENLRVINISNPTNPVLIGNLGVGIAPNSVAVQGDFVFVTDGSSGDLRVINVSNPANPVLARRIALGFPISVAVQGDFAFVLDGGIDDLIVFNIADPANPVLAGSIVIDAQTTSIAVQEGLVFVISRITDGLKVIRWNLPSLTATGIAGSKYAAQTHWETNDANLNTSNSGKVGIGITSPGSPITNSKLEVRGGHVVVSNNFGVLSINSAGNGFGAGMDATADDQLHLYSAGVARFKVQRRGFTELIHGSVGINDWAWTISNSAAPNWLFGARLSDIGFFEMTNNAADNNPNFARLDNGGNWTAVSDRQLKQNILPARGLLEKATLLQPAFYHFKSNNNGKRSLGFIAQEVLHHFPEMVSGTETFSLDYAGMSAIAIGAIQEQQAILQTLQSEIALLEIDNQILKKQLNLQQQQIDERQKIIERMMNQSCRTK